MTITETPTGAPRADLTLIRTYDVPRQTVYDAWTKPEHLAVWWGPHIIKNSTVHLDLRVGGELSIVMHSSEGADYPMRGEFQEIVPGEKLVFTWQAQDGSGGIAAEGVTTVHFAEEGEQTKLTVETYGIGRTPYALQMFKGMEQGWGESLERLGDFSLGWMPTPVFEMSYEVAAPRDLVFKMWSEREHLVNWWVPKEFELLALDVDFKVGGQLLCGITTPDGEQWWSKWIYKEIQDRELIVFINSFSDSEGNSVRSPRWANWPLELETSFRFVDSGSSTTIHMEAKPVGTDRAEGLSFAQNSPQMRFGWGPAFDRLAAAMADQKG